MTGHAPVWLAAVGVALLVGVMIAMWHFAGRHDERERRQRRRRLDDHERRLRAIENYLGVMFRYEPPLEDDEWPN